MAGIWILLSVVIHWEIERQCEAFTGLSNLGAVLALPPLP